MSEPKLEDIDMSATDKEHLGLPEGSRKPFHEALVGFINSTDAVGFTKLALLVRSAIIPKGHDAIIVAIDRKIDEYPEYCRELEEDIKGPVLEQKAEAEVREAEKQKQQATDTEKRFLKKKVDALADLAVIASTHNVSVVTTVAKIQNARSLEEVFEIMQTWSRI